MTVRASLVASGALELTMTSEGESHIPHSKMAELITVFTHHIGRISLETDLSIGGWVNEVTKFMVEYRASFLAPPSSQVAIDPVPLSPMQNWFFGLGLKDLNHFNMPIHLSCAQNQMDLRFKISLGHSFLPLNCFTCDSHL